MLSADDRERKAVDVNPSSMLRPACGAVLSGLFFDGWWDRSFRFDVCGPLVNRSRDVAWIASFESDTPEHWLSEAPHNCRLRPCQWSGEVVIS